MMLVLQGLRPQGRGERAWLKPRPSLLPKDCRNYFSTIFFQFKSPVLMNLQFNMAFELPEKKISLFMTFIHKKAIDIAK